MPPQPSTSSSSICSIFSAIDRTCRRTPFVFSLLLLMIVSQLSHASGTGQATSLAHGVLSRRRDVDDLPLMHRSQLDQLQRESVEIYGWHREDE